MNPVAVRSNGPVSCLDTWTVPLSAVANALLCMDPAVGEALAGAWPLPGAAAARRGRPRVPPRPRGVAPPKTSNGARTSAARRPSRLAIGRPRQSGVGIHPGNRAIARGAKTHAGENDNKESISSRGADEFMKEPRNLPSHRKLHHNGDDEQEAVVAMIEPRLQWPQTLPEPAAETSHAAPSGAPHRHQHGAHADAQGSATVEVAEPGCLRFHDVSQTLRQMRKAARETVGLRYCVHPGAVAVFKHALQADDRQHSAQELPLVAHAVRERVPEALQEAMIRKYSGLGQLSGQQPRPPRPLGSDVLFAVKTISPLPHRLQGFQAHTAATDRQLPHNSFKLLVHQDLSGQHQLLIAWCVDSLDADQRTISHAGMLDVTCDQGMYTVIEPVAGLTVSSTSLLDLVDGMAQLSGCRFVPDAATQWMPDPDDAADVPLLSASHVFVIDTGTQQAAPPSTPLTSLRVDDGRTFLKLYPYTVETTQGQASGALFRACFSVLSDRIVFVDAAGQAGTLGLDRQGSDAAQGARVSGDGAAQRFMQTHGLRNGHTYQAAEIVEILGEHGLTQVPAGEGMARLTLPALPIVGDALLPSTFRFQGTDLQYREPGGRLAVLSFTAPAFQPDSLTLTYDSTLSATVFAGSHRIQHGVTYSRDALTWMLQEHGYVLFPEPDGQL